MGNVLLLLDHPSYMYIKGRITNKRSKLATLSPHCKLLGFSSAMETRDVTVYARSLLQPFPQPNEDMGKIRFRSY